ncbi:MAG: methylenetetrahydrofolate reductase C-terminal domain-containing protein [Pseudorhodoplanes sp.]|nr:methylenetetrahydrofolate reductase C-terminal domain-containing protein [Pseudorhodoplanes sp.]
MQILWAPGGSDKMEALRHWSTRHAFGLKRVYDACSRYVPHLRGALRAIGPDRAERMLTPLESASKALFFDCKMCGQCVLSSTGMTCPLNCAKRMRNGPCGGVSPAGMCEVKPQMRCVWVEATEGRKRIGWDSNQGAKALPPLDHRRAGRSTWIQVIDGTLSTQAPATAAIPEPPREIHPFEQACRSGRFVVTVEVPPPDSADPAVLVEHATRFTGLADAINITDGAGGNCHMSSVAASAILTQHGFTPVWQVACRDRNRIAIQGEILGAAALGIRNVLCLTGDDVSRGDQPEAKPVFDLDSVSLLRIARKMRDGGTYNSGRKIATPPNLFLGATINPFAPPFRDRVANLAQKIAAGARFIQTQFCFDVAALSDFMKDVRARGLHERATIIVGVGTLSSAKALRRMAQLVPGVNIPESLLKRIESAADQRAEAKTILVETIQQLAEIEGIGGVHLMGYRNEDVLVQAIIESGLRTTRADVALQA